MLLVAFAFAIMADLVSSVAYAIEAALETLEQRSGGLAACSCRQWGLWCS